MDISTTLRDEIHRRGITPTELSHATKLPFSTVSEFMRGVRELGTDKTSRIAEFLGFELVVSKIRRNTMRKYLATVAELEKKDIAMDDESVHLLQKHVENLRYLDKEHRDWTEDDAGTAAIFVGNLQWLAEHGWEQWDQDDAETAVNFVGNLQWLAEHGWEQWDQDDVQQCAEFVSNLQELERRGEDPTPDRIQDVAEFIKNLDRME